MVKIDFQKYIRNRCWFGWWYCYPTEFADGDWEGKWIRDGSRRFQPVLIIRLLFNDDESTTNWDRKYDKI